MELSPNIYQFKAAPSFVKQQLPLYLPTERHRWMAEALYQRRVLQGLDTRNPTNFYKSLLSELVSFGEITQIFEIISDTAYGHEPIWNGLQITEQTKGENPEEFIIDSDRINSYRNYVQQHRQEWFFSNEEKNLFSTQLDLGELFHAPVLFLVHDKNVYFYDVSSQSWRSFSNPLNKNYLSVLPFKSVRREDGALDRDTIDVVVNSLRSQCEKVLWRAFFNMVEEDPEVLSIFRIQSSSHRVVGVWALHLYTSTKGEIRSQVDSILVPKDKTAELIRPPAACFRDVSGVSLHYSEEETERRSAALMFLKCLGYTSNELETSINNLGLYSHTYDKNNVFQRYLQLIYDYKDFPHELISRYRLILRLAALYRFAPLSSPSDFFYSFEGEADKQKIVDAIELAFASQQLSRDGINSRDPSKLKTFVYSSLEYDTIHLIENEAHRICGSLEEIVSSTLEAEDGNLQLSKEYSYLIDRMDVFYVKKVHSTSNTYDRLISRISRILFIMITLEGNNNTSGLRLAVIYYRLLFAGASLHRKFGILGDDDECQELAHKALGDNGDLDIANKPDRNDNINIVSNKWLKYAENCDLDFVSCWILLSTLDLIE